MQTVIVSGGSSGIGKACVAKFLQQSYFVYNLDIVKCSDASIANSPKYKYLEVNICNKKQIQGAVQEILQTHSRINVIIISAGKHLSANIENTTDAEFHDLFNLNLFGAYWLIQQIIPHMKQQQSGRIITIGSDQALIAKPNSSVYGMTKMALASLTRSIALDYAKYNIRANYIAAGTIDTPFYHRAINNYAITSGIALTQIEQDEANEQPVGRIGKPSEVAEFAYFLSQDNANFITGAILPIDGGYTTR